MLLVADAGVRNLLDDGFWNLTADSVRLLTMTNFLLHSCASDRACFHPGDPSLAADRSAGLFADRLAAACFVNATVQACVPAPGSRVHDVTLHDRTRNLLRFSHPVACADLNFFRFADRLADGVADVSIAGLSFRAIGCAADITVLGFADGFGDVAADITVAGLINGFADGAADVAVAGLEAGLANRAADIAITGLINGFADGVTFIAVTGFVNVPRAGHGILLGALIVDSAAARDGPLVVDCLTNSLVPCSTTALRCTVVSTRSTCRWSTTFITRRPAVGGFDFDVGCKRQQARNDDPGGVSHQSVP